MEPRTLDTESLLPLFARQQAYDDQHLKVDTARQTRLGTDLMLFCGGC